MVTVRVVKQAAEIIGVEYGSKFSERELMEKFRTLVTASHPDSTDTQAEERFQKIVAAKDVLLQFKVNENGFCEMCNGSGAYTIQKGFKSVKTPCPWCKQRKPF